MWDAPASFASRLSTFLGERLVGQENAVRDVVRALVPRLLGSTFGEHTLGVFLLVGPTGTGKTRIAQGLAEFLLGERSRLLRVNCSLLGAGQSLGLPAAGPEGTNGADRGCRVVLIENIEACSPAILDLWTHAFAHGEIALGSAPALRFERTLFLLQSGVAQRQIDRLVRHRELGFTRDAGDAQRQETEVRELLDRAIEETFPPRFLQHMTRVVHFRRLYADDLRILMGRLLEEATAHFRTRGVELVLDDWVRTQLEDLGLTRARWGTKGLRQVLVERVYYPVSDLLLSGRIQPPCSVWVRKGEQELVFGVPVPATPPDAWMLTAARRASSLAGT